MKLLARILSHGFAIAVVLLLAVGLIYRGELFPEYDLAKYLDFGKPSERQKESTTGQAGRDVVEAEAGAPEPEQAAGNERNQGTIPAAGTESTEATEATGSTSATAPAVAESPEAVPVPREIAQQGEEFQPEIASRLTDDSTPVTAADAAAAGDLREETADTTAASAVLPESEPLVPQSTVTGEPVVKPQEKAYQLLASAREAYWLRDYDIAESKYKDLTRLEPDDPDGYGELGNMYFSQGEWEQAATAYYEAGVRLVGQGLLEQAEELLAVIRGLNGSHADDLERKIKEARSTAD